MAKKKEKKPAKKRNVLTEPAKNQEPEPLETTDEATDDKPTVSKPVGKSRKTQSKETKRQKDAEYQKSKRDEQREEKEVKGEQESAELQLAVETFACMPFDFMAKRDPKWTLTPEERKAFSGSATAMMDKYASTLSGYAVETSFLLCVGSILIPRIMFNGREHQQDIGSPGQAGNGQDVPDQTDGSIPAASDRV
jgi:hypothetical protein